MFFKYQVNTVKLSHKYKNTTHGRCFSFFKYTGGFHTRALSQLLRCRVKIFLHNGCLFSVAQTFRILVWYMLVFHELFSVWELFTTYLACAFVHIWNWLAKTNLSWELSLWEKVWQLAPDSPFDWNAESFWIMMWCSCTYVFHKKGLYVLLFSKTHLLDLLFPIDWYLMQKMLL